MSLTITTLLALISQSSGVFQAAPETSYFKAVDLWLVGCFNAGFMVLLEFLVIIFIRNKEKMVRTLANCIRGLRIMLWTLPKASSYRKSSPDAADPTDADLAAAEERELRNQRIAYRIEIFCRVVMPLLFFTFCLAYTVAVMTTNTDVEQLKGHTVFDVTDNVLHL